MQKTEMRRSPRREIDPLPVSIVQHRGNPWTERLNFGEIRDVSTTGARIWVTGTLVFDVGAVVELICFPKNDMNTIGLQATPPRLTGGVVWKNDAAAQMGVAFTS